MPIRPKPDPDDEGERRRPRFEGGDDVEPNAEQDAALDRVCLGGAERRRRLGLPVFEPDWSKPMPPPPKE